MGINSGGAAHEPEAPEFSQPLAPFQISPYRCFTPLTLYGSSLKASRLLQTTWCSAALHFFAFGLAFCEAVHSRNLDNSSGII